MLVTSSTIQHRKLRLIRMPDAYLQEKGNTGPGHCVVSFGLFELSNC